MSKCKEMFGKAVKLMVDLATMQVGSLVCQRTMAVKCGGGGGRVEVEVGLWSV